VSDVDNYIILMQTHIYVFTVVTDKILLKLLFR
jgi:hypothetical protein